MATPSTFLRKLNERRLLNTVRLARRASRADIERSLKLAGPTVSRIVDRLIEEGWLREVGYAEPVMGRPPMLVEIKPEGLGAIGVEVGRSTVRVVYVNLLGEIRAKEEVPVHMFQSANDLATYINGFTQRAKLSSETVIGVGVAGPGALDSTRRDELFSLDTNPMWTRVPLVEILERELDVPAYLANDANAAALGETWFGKESHARHVAFILADAGLGAGIAIDGSIYEGVASTAGEFAHAIVDLHGNLCEQGHRGCVNTGASQPAILNAISRVRELSSHETFYDVVARAREGVAPDADVISNALDYLAAGVSNIMRIFAPHAVILGGDSVLVDPFMAESLITRILQQFGEEPHAQISVSGFGLWAVSVGASTLVLQQIYDHARLVDTTYDSSGFAR